MISTFMATVVTSWSPAAHCWARAARAEANRELASTVSKSRSHCSSYKMYSSLVLIVSVVTCRGELTKKLTISWPVWMWPHWRLAATWSTHCPRMSLYREHVGGRWASAWPHRKPIKVSTEFLRKQ